MTIKNYRTLKEVSNDFYPDEGLNIRLQDTAQTKEHRLHYHKIKFVKEFCRINELNQMIYDSPNSKIGIVSTGKSFLDTKLALEKIGIDQNLAKEIGIKFLKIAMPWPLEETIIEKFSKGLDKIIVVNHLFEKHLLGSILKEIL